MGAGCFAFIVTRMSCYCICSVALPHGAMFGLQCVIVVFPDHTHLLFETFVIPLVVFGLVINLHISLCTNELLKIETTWRNVGKVC